MIVIREFRIGNRRFLKGENYNEEDAKKWQEAGYLQAQPKTEKTTKKGDKE